MKEGGEGGREGERGEEWGKEGVREWERKGKSEKRRICTCYDVQYIRVHV